MVLERCLYCTERFKLKELQGEWQRGGHIFGPYHQHCIEELIAEGDISVKEAIPVRPCSGQGMAPALEGVLGQG